VLDADRNPLPLVAAAASLGAGGDDRAAATLLDRAAGQSRRTPTYDGDAWVALYPALRDDLSDC
jgi:hypothetical protein